jgi:O-methyltransferase involved in polyketide biosynthesis
MVRADGTTLTGISETALLTLAARAHEARRPERIIDDPMAIRLVESIDYDFSKFGPPVRQTISLRALAYDDNIRRYIAGHPCATVVALAEGLQTTFFRLSGGELGDQFRWLTVDLPPIADLRRRLLPDSPRVSTCAQSALDFSWMDSVDPAKGVFITAEGVLMYLPPEQSIGLIAECARRFPGGQMMFDLPPSWFAGLARRGLRTSLRYTVPPMPFTLSVSELADLVNTVPGIRAVHDLPLPAGRGRLFSALVWTAQRLPWLDPLRPALTLLEFG